jgi:hypothetical protein
MVIYGKKTSKIKNETQTANMAATETADFHLPQVQNTYIWMSFLQLDVLKT